MKTFKKTIAVVCLFFFSTPFLCAAEGIPWETDFKTAMKLAEDSGRLVLIHFYGDACPPCRKMDKEVFALKDVSDALAPYFIPLKVNSETNPKAVKNLKIDSIPMDLVVTPDREIIYRRKGFCTAFQFVNELVSIAVQRQHDLMRQQREEELLAQQTPEEPAVSQTAPLDVSAMQNQNLFPPPAAQQAQSPPATSNPMAPPNTHPVPPQPAPTLPPLSQADSPQADFTPPDDIVLPEIPLPDFSMPIAQQNFNMPQITDTNIPSMEPAAAVENPLNPPIANHFTDTPGNTVMQNDVATENSIAQNNASLFPDESSYSYESPYVLDGFCPVELQDHERWIPGSSDFAIRYKDQYFLFSSEDAMRSFAKNPKMYIPVAMGDDVVQLLQNGKRVKGKRHFGAWYQGRIYLFATQQNYDTFAERPAYFANFASRLETTVSSIGVANRN